MKRILFLFFILFVAHAHSQSELDKVYKPRKLIREISEIIQKNSLYSKSIDWKAISKDAKKLKKNPDGSIDYTIISQFFTKILEDAGDNHSFFLSPTNIRQIDSDKEEIIPSSKLLAGNVALIKVPAFMKFDRDAVVKYSSLMQGQIRKLDQENDITGWIIDLRHNTGGNMWPMLSGLHPILGDEIVGYFIKNDFKSPWKSNVEKNDNYIIKNPESPCAILIDSLTASSGEMTAISLLGRKNTKSFGSHSAGYVTANKTYILSNGSQLLLATSWVADRNMKVYDDKIVPEIITEDNPLTSADETVESAVKWIIAQKK